MNPVIGRMALFVITILSSCQPSTDGDASQLQTFLSENHCDDEFIVNHQNIAGVCKLSDINGCGKNQICVQNGKQSDLGNCYCSSGYKLQENNVSTRVYPSSKSK